MSLDEIRIGQTWKQLGGGPLRGNGSGKLRGIAFWRAKADGWSVSVDANKNCWFDHRDSRGGGVLALVRVARQCSEHSALEWLELYGGLSPSRPLTPLEEKRRRAAEKEAQSMVQWRNEMLEALRCRRNRNWKLYHRSKNWILKYGLGNMRGCLLAEAADICEEEALRTDEAIEKLRELDWDIWVKLYRSRYQRAA
jgi:hypothetical protein